MVINGNLRHQSLKPMVDPEIQAAFVVIEDLPGVTLAICAVHKPQDSHVNIFMFSNLVTPEWVLAGDRRTSHFI